MNFSKKPIINGILHTLGTAGLFTLVMWILSLIKKISLAEQFSTLMIVIGVVGSLGSGVSGYLSAKKANDSAKEKKDQ